MNKNLPIEVRKSNIFTKLFMHIKNFFKKSENKDLSNEGVLMVDSMELNAPKSIPEFESQNDYASNNDHKKKVLEDIIKIIEKNPGVLESLEIEKLEVIDMYYKKKVEEYGKKLQMKLMKS